MRELLEKLVAIPSVSGYETKMREFIENELSDVFDEIKTDALGNIVLHKKGNGVKRVFMTHMDCDGLIATYFDGERVNIAPLGNIKAQFAAYRRITFVTGHKALLLPPSSYSSETKISDFTANLGGEPEQAIPQGTKAYFEDSLLCLSGDFVSAGTLSSRLGIACLIKAAKSADFYDSDVYFIFTVQERLGGRGAGAALYPIEADEVYNIRAAALSRTGCGKNAGVGAGLALNFMSKGFSPDGELTEKVCDICTRNGIDFERFSDAETVSDAMTASKSNKGCRTVEICIPVDNIGSPAETAKLSDAQCVVNAVRALLKAN